MKALRGQFCIRSQLLLGVMMAALTRPAFADTNLTTSVTSPITTSADGNITITSTAAVSSTASGIAGAAVTINSNNDVLVAGGTVLNTAATGGIGVFLNGSSNFAGNLTFDSSGTSTLNVSGDSGYGVLLSGGGNFTGDIAFQTSSVFFLTGNHSTGVEIDAPLNGNVTLQSSDTIYGNGTVGFRNTAPVSGQISIGGSLDLYGIAPTSYSASQLDPLSGSAVLIGGNVSGGFQVLSAGLIQNRSDQPVVFIAPSAGNFTTQNLVLAPLDSSGQAVNISFMNSGTIQTTEGDVTDATTNPGINTVGLRIGENLPANAGTTMLPGGFYNGGIISASARSDTLFASSVGNIGATNATAVEIGKATILAFSRTASVGTGSTTSTIVLDPSASPYDNEYNGLDITVDGQERSITCYTGGNQTVIVAADPSGACVPLALGGTSADSLSSAPAPGDPYVLFRSSAFVNAGTIAASTAGAKGGIAYGIHILGAGNVSTLENDNLIEATASTTDTTVSTLKAYAIRDESGTLTTINDFGTISAAATTLDNGSQQAVAIDLSQGSNVEVVSVSAKSGLSTMGTVTGDILFGSAQMTSQELVPGNASTAIPITGNHLFIDGAATDSSGNITSEATVSGSIHPASGGTLDIEVSNDVVGAIQPSGTPGTAQLFASNDEDLGGLLRTENTITNQLVVNTQGQVAITLDKNAVATSPRIDVVTASGSENVTGVAAFRDGSQITVTPTSFLPLSSTASTTYVLIHADTLLSIPDPATYNTNAIPFLLTGTITQNGNDLDLTVQRKSAAALGLTGNSAAIYEALSKGALNNDVYGAALLALPDADSVRAAVASTLPDIGGGIRALSISMTDQATGVIGARQRNLVTSADPAANEFRFWGQEFYNNVSDTGSTGETGYGGAGQGVALGGEWGSLATGRYGVAYSFFTSEETERHPVDNKTDGDWDLISMYAGWRAQNFFVSPEASVGAGSFLSRRTITAGNITSATQTATASWTGYIAAGGVSSGYIFNFGDFQIIPEIALDAMYLRQSAYTETGAEGIDLSLSPQNQESLRLFAGVVGQASFHWADASLVPKFLAGWSHELDDNPATIDGSFESTPGSAFHLVGPMLDTDHAVGGASFNYVTRNWQAGLNLDAQVGSRTMDEAATVNLSSRF